MILTMSSDNHHYKPMNFSPFHWSSETQPRDLHNYQQIMVCSCAIPLGSDFVFQSVGKCFETSSKRKTNSTLSNRLIRQLFKNSLTCEFHFQRVDRSVAQSWSTLSPYQVNKIFRNRFHCNVWLLKLLKKKNLADQRQNQGRDWETWNSIICYLFETS